MTISDARFAGQVVYRTGKIFVFDDPGCLASYLARHPETRDQVSSLWVNDYAEPDSLLDATTATYLESDGLRTPMASRLAAFRSGAGADSARAQLGGTTLSWPEVSRRADLGDFERQRSRAGGGAE